MARKKITKREDGRIKKTFTHAGKQYYVYGYSQQELDNNYRKKVAELEAGTKDRENPTLNRYYEIFTDNRRRKVKAATIRAQSCQFRNCADIVIDSNGKTLGEYRIADITPDDIQLVQRELEKTGRKDGHTTETVNNCIDHLRHVFNQAIRSRKITENPCDAVENIKRTEPPARETIHRALTHEETAAFFEAAKDSTYINHFRLMIQTGIRIGELGALLPFDIDTTEKMMHIQRTITRDEIGGYLIGDTPKTDAGNRYIPLTDQAIQTIRNQKSLNRMLYGETVRETLFRSAEGALLREYPVNREIKRICKEIGIEKFTCHAFRATFATRFIEQRPQDYKILSEILGHSNVKITLNLYTHVMKESKIAAMNGVEIAL